jgi:hypothetical protein
VVTFGRINIGVKPFVSTIGIAVKSESIVVGIHLWSQSGHEVQGMMIGSSRVENPLWWPGKSLTFTCVLIHDRIHVWNLNVGQIHSENAGYGPRSKDETAGKFRLACQTLLGHIHHFFDPVSESFNMREPHRKLECRLNQCSDDRNNEGFSACRRFFFSISFHVESVCPDSSLLKSILGHSDHLGQSQPFNVCSSLHFLCHSMPPGRMKSQIHHWIRILDVTSWKNRQTRCLTNFLYRPAIKTIMEITSMLMPVNGSRLSRVLRWDHGACLETISLRSSIRVLMTHFTVVVFQTMCWTKSRETSIWCEYCKISKTAPKMISFLRRTSFRWDRKARFAYWVSGETVYRPRVFPPCILFWISISKPEGRQKRPIVLKVKHESRWNSHTCSHAILICFCPLTASIKSSSAITTCMLHIESVKHQTGVFHGKSRYGK